MQPRSSYRVVSLLLCTLLSVISCGRHRAANTIVPVAPAPTLAEPTDHREFTERMAAGLRLSTAGEYATAAQAFDRAIELRNSDPGAWLERGRVEMLRNNPPAALMYLQVATGLDPSNPRARGWRAEVHHTLGEQQEAIEQYSRALDMGRASVARAALLVGKGDALLALGNSDQALRDYDEAMRVWPGSVTGSLRRANLLLLLERPADAIEEASRALAVGGERAEAYLLRGTAYTPGAIRVSRSRFCRRIATRPGAHRHRRRVGRSKVPSRREGSGRRASGSTTTTAAAEASACRHTTDAHCTHSAGAPCTQCRGTLGFCPPAHRRGQLHRGGSGTGRSDPSA